LPISDSTDIAAAAVSGANFRARRTADGIVLEFPVLRAPAAALGLGAFALLCGAMPALGLSALLPLETADASAMVSLALIGGLAAPFLLASVVFAALAVYLLANSLHVAIDTDGIRTERHVFGRLTRVRRIARKDIAAVEPRIGARYQNVFSAAPRYALVVRHREDRAQDVVVAEDLVGQALMIEARTLVCAVLGMK
jgi:hypothetical protein